MTIIRGYLAENAVENKCLQSSDMATTWVKIDAGDSFDLNSIAAVDKSVTADGLIADATDGEHGVKTDYYYYCSYLDLFCFCEEGRSRFHRLI